MTERKYTIRCQDCPRSELITWLPMQWAATCHECAQTSVTNHLLEHPGHRCEVLPGGSDDLKTRSKSTVRLLRKTGGW